MILTNALHYRILQIIFHFLPFFTKPVRLNIFAKAGFIRWAEQHYLLLSTPVDPLGVCILKKSIKCSIKKNYNLLYNIIIYNLKSCMNKLFIVFDMAYLNGNLLITYNGGGLGEVSPAHPRIKLVLIMAHDSSL